MSHSNILLAIGLRRRSRPETTMDRPSTISPSSYARPYRPQMPVETYLFPPGGYATLFLCLFLRSGRLCCCLLLGLGVGGTLGHAAPHRACDRSGSRTLPSIARDCADSGASSRPSRGSSDTCALLFRGILGSLLLSQLLFFFALAFWRRRLCVDPCALLGHTVTFSLILELLIGVLAIPRNANMPMFWAGDQAGAAGACADAGGAAGCWA